MFSHRRASTPPPTRLSPGPGRSTRWLQGFAESHYYLLVPLVSIVIFLVMMSLILWSLNRRETEQQQDTLYRNVAWAQQQIRLNMLAIQDQVSSLARDTAANPQDIERFRSTASEIMQNHSDIIFMNWLDAQQHPRWAVPADSPFASRLASLGKPMEDELLVAFRAARDSRRSAYSTLIYDATGASYIVLQTPVMREREFLGTIGAVYSVEGLLVHELPQELGNKFKVSFVDTHNNELATTSTRPPLPRDVSYELLLDPPGHSLAVRIYSYPAIGNFVNNTLVWLIVGLSCFVLWSLWSLWRHTRQRFEAQQALFNETSFRRAMENSIVIGMRVLDLHGQITYVNPAFCRMTGWDESDLLGKMPPYPYWPSDDIHEMQRRIDMTLRGKAPSHGFEIRVQRKDRSIFYARMFVSPLVDSHGRQTGWMSSLTDISEPKRAREELAAAHERFTTVLESLDASVSVLAVDKVELLFANRYYRQLFGTRPEGHLELAGGSADTSPSASDTIDMVDTFAGLPAASLTDTASETQEIYLPHQQRWFEVRRQYIQWVDGHLAQLQVATDITARRHAEELARQQDQRLQFTGRLMTMGEMASSLAHELNQPLAAINNYCMGTAALVRAGKTAPDTLLPALEKTSQQAVRAGMIIKRIRSFVKRSEPKRQSTSIYEIVADAVGLAEIEARKRRIRIATDLPAGLPQIYVDPVLIEQVLVNLLKNAAEAMQSYTPPSGQRRDPAIHLRVLKQDKAVEFIVADQGPGVDEATMEQLFEPFFSTKSDGMGMGLNICRSIIESHHGRLWVENNYVNHVRSGCSFCILLPLDAGTTSAEEA